MTAEKTANIYNVDDGSHVHNYGGGIVGSGSHRQYSCNRSCCYVGQGSIGSIDNCSGSINMMCNCNNGSVDDFVSSCLSSSAAAFIPGGFGHFVVQRRQTNILAN